MGTYIGNRDVEGFAFVRVRENEIGRELLPRYDLYNHSPDGFEWGYGGSGPAQLALALCADAIQDDELAVRVYRDFLDMVVARLPRLTWTLSTEQVLRTCMQIMKEKMHGKAN